MKLLLLIITLFAMTSTQASYQDDVIELKNGKRIETKITSHTKNTITTEAGKYKIKDIKTITFFTKNYDDLEFYKALEKAGVEYKFAVTPH